MNFKTVISLKSLFNKTEKLFDKEMKKLIKLRKAEEKKYNKLYSGILMSINKLYKIKESKKSSKKIKTETIEKTTETQIIKPIKPIEVSIEPIETPINNEPIYKCVICNIIKTVYKYNNDLICEKCFNNIMIKNNNGLRLIGEEYKEEYNSLKLENIFITRPLKNKIIEESVELIEQPIKTTEESIEIKEESVESIEQSVETIENIQLSPLEKAIKENKDNKLIFGIFKKYNNNDYIKYKYFDSYDQVYNKDYNACEFLETNYKKDKTYLKLYFDIESDDINFLNNYDDHMRDQIIKYFIINFLRFLVSYEIINKEDSKQIKKTTVITKSENINVKMSYHILFNELTFEDKKVIKDIINIFINSTYYCDIMEELENYKMNFPDLSVYNKNGFFRCINNSKVGKNNCLRLVKLFDEYEDNDDKSYYFINTPNKGLYHNNHIKEDITINNNDDNLNLITNINDEIICEILEALNPKRASDYEDWLKIFFILRGMNKDYLNLFINFSKRTTKNNFNINYIQNLWAKYKIKDNKEKLKFGTLLLYLKEDNKEQFNIIIQKIRDQNTDPRIKELINSYYDINNNSTINKYILNNNDLDYNLFLKPDIFINRNEKAILIKSHLGTGKSSSMIAIIKKYILERKRILILTPRILYAVSNNSNLNNNINNDNDVSNLIKNINNNLRKNKINDIKFTLYNDNKCTFREDYLICQVESLHKIKIPDYDLVIADEIEGILERFNVNNLKCHKSNYINNYDTFEEIIVNCKKFIGCDAFINNTSINLINDLFKNDDKILIINEANPFNRKAINYEKKETLLNDIKDQLTKGKKIVLFTCSKNDVINYEEYFKQNFKNKNIICHHGEKIRNEQYEILEDVNKNWVGDLLIYNSVITVGINFNIKHYDQLYIIADSYINCRDIFQASQRVRHLNDDLLKYHIIAKDNKETLFNFDDIKNNINDKINLIREFTNNNNLYEAPEWLKNLIINLSYESYLNKYYYESIYNYFLELCGYKKDGHVKDINKFYLNKLDKFKYESLKDYLEILKENENKTNNEIREEITLKQKTGKITNIIENYIKEVIDFENIINVNGLDIDKINDLFGSYLNKHHNHYRNIQILYNFRSGQEAQEYYNRKYKNNLLIIKPIGQQIQIIKDIFEILEINTIKNLTIDYNTYNKIYKYIESNENKINTSFNFRLRGKKEDNNIRNLLKQTLYNFCGINIKYEKHYSTQTKEENKKFKIESLYSDIEFNKIYNDYNMELKFIDD